MFFFYSKFILEIEGLKPGCDCYVHAGKQKMGKQQCDAQGESLHQLSTR